MNKLYIGWSKCDITPEKKCFIMGQFHTRISKDVVSPLTATALAMETRDDQGNTTGQSVFVSCDLVAITFKEELNAKVSALDIGLDPDKISLSATHTHTGPTLINGFYSAPDNDPDFMPPDDARDFIVEKLAALISDAWKQRQPGGISFGFDYAAVGFNRRAVYADSTGLQYGKSPKGESDGNALMYGDTSRDNFVGLEGGCDHTVNTMFTWNEQHQLTGMLINVGCPSQCDETGEFYSADFWHETRLEMASCFSPDIFVLPQCAAAGDQSPRSIVDRQLEQDQINRRNQTTKQIIAKRIRFAVESCFQAAAESVEYDVVLRHECHRFVLPLRMVSDAEYNEEKEMLANGGTAWPFGPICNLIERYENQKIVKEREFECHITRIGDAAFATNPFELFMDYGLQIKCRSKAKQTFTVQLANSCDFYLPTAKAVQGGHYSAIIKSNWVGPEGGKILVEKTLAEINKDF